VVGSSEVRRLEERVRELERLLAALLFRRFGEGMGL
jgi:hypothetical protein